MRDVYAVSAAPHIKQRISVPSVMWRVVIALIPALLASVYFFGIRALLLTLYGIVAAVLTEAIIQKVRKVPLTITDGSAVVTGMLVASMPLRCGMSKTWTGSGTRPGASIRSGTWRCYDCRTRPSRAGIPISSSSAAPSRQLVSLNPMKPTPVD